MEKNIYSNTTIYKIVNKVDITDTNCYVGHTCDIQSRRRHHKSACAAAHSKKFNYKLYKHIRDHGGMKNFQMVIVENANLNNYDEASKLERVWYERLNCTLNTQYPARTSAERSKIHYYKHKNSIQIRQSAKSVCACGGTYTKAHKATHKKTQRHIEFELNN